MRREIAFGLSRLRRGSLARLVLWSVPEAVPAALLGVALARAVDDGFLARRPLVGLAWVGVILVAGLIGAVGSWQVLRSLGDVVEPLRDDLVRRVVAAALARAVRERADDGAVARLTRQVEIVRDSFAGLLLVTRGFLVSVVGAVAGLLTLSPVIAALVVPPFVVGLAGFVACLGLAARRQLASVQSEERLAAAAVRVVAGARDITVCGAGEYAAAMVGGPIEDQVAAERALARVALLRTACFAVGGWAPLIALLAAIGWLTARGLSAGALLGALFYVLLGLQPALNRLMGGIGSAGLRYAVTMRRLLDLPVEAPSFRHGSGDRLVATGIGFAYGRLGQPLFEDLSLTVGDGDHLAVIGPSGIGKSTLAAVLCGLREPSRGNVVLADRVLIPQEAYVFSASLRDNLVYLRPSAADPQVYAALAAVGALPLARDLGGLDAMVDPGVLSAGQRQLIALARAYLSAARVVVLDEATCHLDPAAEAVAERAFAERPGGLVVVAHRLSSALRAKRILLLDGSSATVGDHATLLARSPLYRDLIASLSPDSSAAQTVG